MKTKRKLILAIDFDGTICRENFPDIGAPITGAFKYLRKLKSEGHELILWTCRSNDSLDEAITWLERHGCFIFDTVNRNTETWKHRYPKFANDEPSSKVFADIYIDDKSVGGLPDWATIYYTIKEIHQL